MGDDPEKRASELAKKIFDKISDALNELSKEWLHIDPVKEPERYALEKHLWGKGLLAALAQQLGIIEAALIMGDGLDAETVHGVREMWIRAGHRICGEAMEAPKAEKEEN